MARRLAHRPLERAGRRHDTTTAPREFGMLGRAFAPGPHDMPPAGGSPASRPARHPVSLSVGDGFKFGCGFVLALAITMLSGVVLLSLLILLATVLGADLLTFFRLGR
jgi:hypothetical protein